ncbi:MAG TPA: SLC13 family permease [Acidobacteriota bacterium]|nr:SLC13 family permease [Acidobacteriota bacterium]
MLIFPVFINVEQMTWEIGLVFAMLLFTVVLFFLEWLSVDVVTLLLLFVLVLTGILTPADAFSGFSNDIIIILASVFVLSGAFLQTGVMDGLGDIIWKLGGTSFNRILVFMMLLTCVTSAFMNNTTTTAVFLPAVLAVCRKSKISPSKLLIPLSFASILGGTCTLVGTSTNVAASGFLARSGFQPFTLFEFLPVGATACLLGIVYMVLFGHRLLPSVKEATLTEEYEIKEYLSEIVITRGSSLAGKRLRDSGLTDKGITVLEVIRRKQKTYAESDTVLEEGDVLIVNAARQNLLLIKEIKGLEIKADVKLGDKDLITSTIKIVEAIVMPQSVLVGRTIKEVDFRNRFGVTALAIYRKGHGVAEKLGTIPLRVGDVLLLQGRVEQFDSLVGNPDLWILEEMHHVPFRRRKGIYAVAALGLAVFLGGFEVVPLSLAFLGATLVVILTKCITAEEAYNYIDWRLLILIGGMTSFGFAMDQTGAAKYAAAAIVSWLAPWGIFPIMLGFVILTIVLTQPMSNASAALVVLPVALNTAAQLGVDPRSFAILVTLAASLSFITPLEPSCLIVYGPGKYRFRHFVLVGFPLTAAAIGILLVLVPILWPL